MPDLPEPDPSDMLYLFSGVELQKLDEVAWAFAALRDAQAKIPGTMSEPIAAVVSAAQVLLTDVRSQILVHHDPRWIVEDELEREAMRERIRKERHV